MPAEGVMPSAVIAALPTLDLGRLKAGDKDETEKLFQNCVEYGFMHLDLRSDPEFIVQWDKTLDAMGDYFEQPLDVKMLDDRKSDTLGYEGIGTSAGADLTKVDAYESLKVSRREYLNRKVELTSSLKDQQNLLFSFMEKCHDTVIMMLSRLSDAYGLNAEDRFENFHTDTTSHLSTLGILHYPKDDEKCPNKGIGHNKHTDVGTLTFLLTKQWGLQILSPQASSWSYVAPRPGHAIVRLCGAPRVTLYEKQHEDRYSIAYFLRMADDTAFNDQDGKAWTAKQWHDFKFNVFRKPFDSIRTLTAGMETNDVLIGKPEARGVSKKAFHYGSMPVTLK